MTATVSYEQSGSGTYIYIKRTGAFCQIPVTGNFKRTLKNVIVNLSNLGYRVIVLDERS